MICFASVAPAEVAIDFNRDIRPILSNKCFACHGPDESHVEAGLRLDSAAAATRELDSGVHAIVPGDLSHSELIARITSPVENERMPPQEFGKKLSEVEIKTLERWVASGASFAKHWAYVLPTRPAVPPPIEAHQSWPKNAIDNFALDTMVRHGLKPKSETDRYALIRRVCLDLTGLPPTIEDAEAFVNDPDPLAYEKLVDHLLKQASFGEHWARKWLDLARYADSAGYADDPPRTIWAYRDWVIRAINNDMGFDEFTRLQLAGDLLPNISDEQLIATAFHRNTLTNNEGGTQDEEFRNVAVVDRVNTTMAVWMGTTMACAQCHTHKFDPITQEEYFKFFDLWNNTADADRRDESPLVEIYTNEQKVRQETLRLQIEELRLKIRASSPELVAEQALWESRLRSEPTWNPLRPATISRQSGLPVEVREDNTILIATSADTDTYAVELTGNSSNIAALRLETLPEKTLPGQGAGHGGGNFVITNIHAELIPADNSPPLGRFVRITNHGQGKILSLAEVQVFSGGENIAASGKATQQSTAFAGPPQLAIDGNTDGIYQNNSVTHTDTVDEPWWELDLGSDRPMELIRIWNRTDGNLQVRLKDYSIELLDSERKVVLQQEFTDSPNPSSEYATSRIRRIELSEALADYAQQGFNPSKVITEKPNDAEGWAVAGETQVEHQLVLLLKQPITIQSGDRLRVTIAQQSKFKQHLLGHFRFSFTDNLAAIERWRLPKAIAMIVDQPSEARSKDAAEQLSTYFHELASESLRPQRTELAKQQKELSEMKPATSAPVLREQADKRRETRLQYRGNYLDLGPTVTAGVPAVFSDSTRPPVTDRLSLAQWLVDDNNPLTARVIVNRIWEQLYGNGIVATSEEFGSQGEVPTHPELLDWLATELIRSEWNTKSIIRTVVTSATYRQSSLVTAEDLAIDADNRWYARGPRVRLSAEMVRDQALSIGGLLSLKMYGPPVNPPQPNLGLSAAFGGSTDWKTSDGVDRYRRAIYTTWRRSNPYPSMATFDAPNQEVCTIRRNRTNTPLQSLVTLNDPVYVEAAQALARQALAQEGDLKTQLVFAFRRCVLRPPTEIEVSTLIELFNDARQDLADQPGAAMKLATDPIGPLPTGVEPIDAAAMSVVGNVLLNLDEMFLKR